MTSILYEVDDEKGTRVTAYAGTKMLASFVVGKTATGGTYIRPGNDSDVYKVKQGLKYLYDKEEKRWIQLKLFEDEAAQVQSVQVELNDAPKLGFALADKTWTLTEPKTPPKSTKHAIPQRKRTREHNIDINLEDKLQ